MSATTIVPVDYIFDSADRTSGTNDQPLFSLPYALENVVGLSVVQANIPFSYYVIRPNRNRIVFRLNGVSYACVVTPGTYQYSSIEQAIKNAMKYTSQGLLSQLYGVHPTFVDTFRVYVDNATGSLILNGNAAFDLRIAQSVDGGNLDTDLTYTIGYPETQATYIANNATTFPIRDNNNVALTGYYLKSPLVPMLTGPAQMYVCSPELAPGLYGAVRHSSAQTIKNVIAFFPVNAAFLEQIVYEPQNPVMLPCHSNTVSQVSFSLAMDSEYGSVDLNNQSFQIILRFYVEIRTAVDYTNDRYGNYRLS